MSRPEEIEINVAEAESPKQLHSLLYHALNFPDYYGSNSDAFWDVIAGEDVMPRRLVLRGWSKFEAQLPREAGLMRECLNDYHEERPDRPCRVVYA